jgi:hypothetical protein
MKSQADDHPQSAVLGQTLRVDRMREPGNQASEVIPRYDARHRPPRTFAGVSLGSTFPRQPAIVS